MDAGNVLLIVDELTSRGYLIDILAHIGYRSVLSASPAETAARLAEGTFEAVLIDDLVPYAGTLSASWLREHGHRGPIVFFSWLAGMSEDTTGHPERDLVEFLPRPATPAVLKHALERLTQRYRWRELEAEVGGGESHRRAAAHFASSLLGLQ